jgi:type II secretory pathway component PulF
MPTFRYQALNAEQQVIAGQVEAEAVQQAIAQLEAAGLIVQSIGFAGTDAPASEPRVIAGAERAAAPPREAADADVERAVLHAHMAKVLQRGREIAPALAAFAEEMPAGRRRRELTTVCRLLQQGDAAAATTALAELPDYCIPLLSATAASSDPSRVLREFLDESQRAEDLRRQWWLSLVYPTVVSLLAAAVLVGIAVFIVPAFAEIFADFDLEVPKMTMSLLAFSRWLTNPSGIAGGIAVVAALAVITVLGTGTLMLPEALGARMVNPFGGLFGRSTPIARFARFLADLLEAGVDAPSALRIAGFATRRPRLRSAAWNFARTMETSAAYAAATGDTNVIARKDRSSFLFWVIALFPLAIAALINFRSQRGPEYDWINSVIALMFFVWLIQLLLYARSQWPGDVSPLTSTVQYALRAEMPAAARVQLLKEVSNSYADRTRNRLSWTRGIVEPLAICAIGLVIGLVVIALYLPLVDLINNLSG